MVLFHIGIHFGLIWVPFLLVCCALFASKSSRVCLLCFFDAVLPPTWCRFGFILGSLLKPQSAKIVSLAVSMSFLAIPGHASELKNIDFHRRVVKNRRSTLSHRGASEVDFWERK